LVFIKKHTQITSSGFKLLRTKKPILYVN